MIETWLGFEKHQIVRVVLHSHFDMEAHVASLNHVGAAGLIFDTAFVDQVDSARSQVSTVSQLDVAIGSGCPDWAVPSEQLVGSGAQDDAYLWVDEDAPCFLPLACGHDGDAQGLGEDLPGRGRRSSTRTSSVCDSFGTTPLVSIGDVNLHFHPLQWASGFQTLYPYLMRGARSVLMDDSAFDATAFVDLLVKEQVTGTLMPAPLLPPSSTTSRPVVVRTSRCGGW